MDNAIDLSKMNCKGEAESESSDETWDSDDDDETIARIQRAHFAQTSAMTQRRRPPPKPRPMSQKRKMEAVRSFHDFTKKLKKDTGITIRSLTGNNMLGLNDFTSSDSDSQSDSDGLSEEEFKVDPSAVEELTEENESYIDPETGDIIENKTASQTTKKPPSPPPKPEMPETPKTLTISDIINEGDLDLSKNVEIAEVDQGELCSEKNAEDLLDLKQEDGSQDFDITEKLKEMGEISVKALKKDEPSASEGETEKKPDCEEEKKTANPNALNVRRNIREVMDEKQLDASTLAAQRQESERLARVQEQQRIIREVQRQIAMNRQNKVHQKTLQLLQGGSSILKKAMPGQKLNLPNTVLVKLPSGEVKKTTVKQGQVEVTRIAKPGPSVGQKVLKMDQKSEKKEVVEIVDSSSGEETSLSSSDSDDCIMLSDSEVPPSPEAEEDPNNSGLHVNDAYNIPDEQGRVQINVGHTEGEEDIFLAPQIARVIKPHQIGGVRFLFDNIIESVERFSTSTGFGCILAHSMGLGKTLQIVCFCDIFLRHTTSKTVLCIMPINTLQNWVAEFNMWLPTDATGSALAAHGEVRPRNFPIYVLNDSHKTLQMRAKVVKEWSTAGGVLMIGYELYRLLSMKKDKKPRKKKKADLKQEEKDKCDDKKNEKSELCKDVNEDTQGSDNTNQSKQSDATKQEKDDAEGKMDGDKDDKKDEPTDEEKKLLDEMYEALVRPGPDLVICDEGHRIKNSHSNISYALKQMRTKRRVVLTGYPLQNNLLEYWCMVDFVRPNYLGSKTEFCNMFERPIQNGQCIDSTPQDIRLMRYRAHVLHSLLVGFVQRRSHAVLQSTLPQKAEYVLLVRMTSLQRKLYDRFMNEVVRSTSVPNPLKAFAICCKIWNHPDVLYNFLKKRSEVNIAIEEDLDLEEIGGVTKAGRATRSKAQPKRAAKPRVSNKKGSSKKPAATIPPNTTSAVGSKPHNAGDPNGGYGNAPYPPYGPPGPGQQYRPDQSGPHPPHPGYQNQPGYYPPNQGYNQNYGNNYYHQQPPYGNYPNQYPPSNSESNQGYNQNYWNNGNYYGNSTYYNNQPYSNNQTPQEYRNNVPSDFNNQQQYPQQYNSSPSDPAYQGNAIQPYQNNQDPYANQQRPPYQQNTYQNPQVYPAGYNANPSPVSGTPYPNHQPQNYPSQPYPNSFGGEYGPYNAQYDPRGANYSPYPNNGPNHPPLANISTNDQPGPSQPDNNQVAVPDYSQNNIKANNDNGDSVGHGGQSYGNPPYNYNHQNTPYTDLADPNREANYPGQYNQYPSHLETKPPLGSSGSPIPPWPLSEALKLDSDKPKIEKVEDKHEVKSESDSEVKIEDLDTKTIINDESKEFKKDIVKSETVKEEPKVTESTDPIKPENESKKDSSNDKKSDDSDSGDDTPKKTKKDRKQRKSKDTKKSESKRKSKAKSKGRKDRKASKDCSDSDGESEKEEKLNREEELALVKKAEEMTYDWAAELLKDYIPGIIENSAKMELFFFILNESIRLGDRLLLFSQSLFTLNLIEDFLERNYIPGTNCLWERNTNYYRLDGSTHALEREKLINEFNANPHVYLFLVSTRAGSLGINLVGANRVIVFDASWNPCHDTQAVCRVYRYGQKKPCFVYRFVMDWCLEKKIYDRQINKQGMADRVVDECNPDAVLSMKEITNLCFDADEKESEAKDLSEHKDKYIDVVMQQIIGDHGKLLSKEPFQHESLLVDRKEKKLSSAEKRLAQRGYELEKKAASAPKPTPAYRTVRAADGSVVQRPVASVRPMQHGARWIPADVWRRQGMTAQEMTLPLDVVIPTNSAEKTNIVLKAGQRVMVLKSPKGIYMQLESGKIIAIKTSFKGLPQKTGDNKDNPVGKKVLGSRPTTANLPGSLKNNSAITITSKTGTRPNLQRVMNRPNLLQNKLGRPFLPGQNFKPRLGTDSKSFSMIRAKAPLQQGRVVRSNLPGSLSITKIQKDPKKTSDESNDSTANKMETASDEDTHVLDSEDEDVHSESVEQEANTDNVGGEKENSEHENSMPKSENVSNDSEDSKSSIDDKHKSVDVNAKGAQDDNITLTTDEKLPSEFAFDDKSPQDETHAQSQDAKADSSEKASKISLLKNYRHQRPGCRPSLESSLSQLERTACVLNTEGMPDFRKNLDDITQSYSPGSEERIATKSKKKKSPNKPEGPSDVLKTEKAGPVMSHSVSSLLGSNSTSSQKALPRVGHDSQNTAPVAPMNSASGGPQPRFMGQNTPPIMPHSPSVAPITQHHSHMNPVVQGVSPIGPSTTNLGHTGMVSSAVTENPVLKSPMGSSLPLASSMMPTEALPGPAQSAYPNSAMENPYSQYPGYGVGYGGYPNASYYGNYGGGYYPPYPAAPHPYPPAPSPSSSLPHPLPLPLPAPAPAPAPSPDLYPPPNHHQW